MVSLAAQMTAVTGVIIPDDAGRSLTGITRMSEPLLLIRAGPVAELRFNRPQSLNAIDAATARAMLAACEQLAGDRGVRAVVLSGEGKGFMAGGDLAEMKADPGAIAREIIAPLHAALRVLAAIDAPVIASVHGVVAGAGVSSVVRAVRRRAGAAVGPGQPRGAGCVAGGRHGGAGAASCGRAHTGDGPRAPVDAPLVRFRLCRAARRRA